MNAPRISIRLDAQGRINEDLECSQCGYNLRSLDPSAACVECGQPIRVSLARQRLASADRNWLANVRHGVLMIEAVPPCAAFIAAVVLLEWYNALPLVVPTAVGVAGIVLAVMGVWLLGQPEPTRRGPRAHLTFGAWATYLTVIAAVIVVSVIAWGPGRSVPLSDALISVAGAMAMAAAVCVLLHVRELARRIPNRRLAIAAGFTALAMALVAAGIMTLVFGIVQRVIERLSMGGPNSLFIWFWAAMWQFRLLMALLLLGLIGAGVLGWFWVALGRIAREQDAAVRQQPSAG